MTQLANVGVAARRGVLGRVACPIRLCRNLPNREGRAGRQGVQLAEAWDRRWANAQAVVLVGLTTVRQTQTVSAAGGGLSCLPEVRG